MSYVYKRTSNIDRNQKLFYFSLRKTRFEASKIVTNSLTNRQKQQKCQKKLKVFFVFENNRFHSHGSHHLSNQLRI